MNSCLKKTEVFPQQIPVALVRKNRKKTSEPPTNPTLPETNSSPLKTDGWNTDTRFLLGVNGLLSMAVSFRVPGSTRGPDQLLIGLHCLLDRCGPGTSGN